MNPSDRLFVFGCGYSASAFVASLDPALLAGVTTRSADKAAVMAEKGWKPLLFGGTASGADEIETALGETTHLLVSIAPGEAGDPVLSAYRDTVLSRTPNLAWIGYLSTVGVYGDQQGNWVDETARTLPNSARTALPSAASLLGVAVPCRLM